MTSQDEAERRREQLIENRAYEIYQARGGQHGFDKEDWAQAELEVDGIRIQDDRVPGSEDEETEERK